MKRLRKRMTALLLSCLLSFSCVACSYENVQATGLEVPVTLQILESILLSFGISVVTGDMINNAVNDSWWDGTGALQPAQDMYDQLEEEYTKERLKVINGSGGSGGSDPDPTPTPATTGEPEPVPTPEIPTFEQLSAQASSNGFLEMTAATFSVLGAAVSNWWDKIMGRVDIDSSFSDQEVLDILNDPGFSYYHVQLYNTSPSYIVKFKEGSFFVIDKGWYFVKDSVQYTKPVNGTWQLTYTYTKDQYKGGGYQGIGSTNIPRFNTYAEGLEWSESIRTNSNSLPSKEEIWVHPDLQDTYQNNGKLEYPQQAPQPLNIPSIEQLQELARKLNPEINPEYSPEIAPQYIKELIEQLQRQPSVNPDPGTDPNPNPDPNPDPDPDVTPDPDEPGVDDGDPVKDYKTDLRQIFPFCIPFDLINLLDALDAEPVAPKFEIPVDIEVNNPFTKTKILDYHNVIVIDLSVYEDAVKVVRIFEILFFILGLLLITRQQMIKG